jgi:hypothetical protein
MSARFCIQLHRRACRCHHFDMSIPRFGFETLYKTDSPADFGNSEYYQVQLDVGEGAAPGTHVYFVREQHGYFDNANKRAVHPVMTLSPQEGFATFEEAEARYQEQLRHRASEGFVHAFSLDPWEGMKYRKLPSGIVDR